jgi:hypothetical protein
VICESTGSVRTVEATIAACRTTGVVVIVHAGDILSTPFSPDRRTKRSGSYSANRALCAWQEELPRVCSKPFEQDVRSRASDLAESYSTVQISRTVRAQRPQLNRDATFLCVLHHLPLQRGADAAVLELGH